jgi:hypothetical protein
VSWKTVSSQFYLYCRKQELIQLISSLAMAEMKILLRTVYTQCSTRISYEMDGDMEMSDQIISSRPKGQTCKLMFERIST